MKTRWPATEWPGSASAAAWPWPIPGLGPFTGLAGVIGGMTGAAHGAICGAPLGPALAVNQGRATGGARDRIEEALALISGPLGCTADTVPGRLASWALAAGLPRLGDLGVKDADHEKIAEAATSASSSRGNPVALAAADFAEILARAH